MLIKTDFETKPLHPFHLNLKMFAKNQHYQHLLKQDMQQNLINGLRKIYTPILTMMKLHFFYLVEMSFIMQNLKENGYV